MLGFVFNNIDFAHKIDEVGSPTEVYEKHLHHFYELMFFVKGSVNYVVENKSQKLFSGNLVFIRPAESHYADVNQEYRYERYVVKFDDSFLPKFLIEKLKNVKTFYLNSTKFTPIFKEMQNYTEMYTPEEAYVLLMGEILKVLIYITNDSGEVDNIYNEQIGNIIAWIDAHIKEPISIERISHEFNYSSSHICNEFKKYVKIPIMKYIKTKKLIAARDEIVSGRKKNEVAEEYSFENYSTFYRLYIKTFKTSPSGKRSKNEKD